MRPARPLVAKYIDMLRSRNMSMYRLLVLPLNLVLVLGCSEGEGSSNSGTGGSTAYAGSSPGGAADGPETGEASSSGGASSSGASTSLAGEGDSCSASVLCDLDLGCINSVCEPVGALGEPCDPFVDSCDEGLICHEGSCKESVNVRFCHCVYAGGGSQEVSALLTLGGVEFPPTLTDVCSPCQKLPHGEDLSYSLETVGGTHIDTGTLSPESQTDGVFYFTTSSNYGTADDACTNDTVVSCNEAFLVAWV